MVHIMYYRINIISFDASRKDEFIAHFNSVGDQIKAIPGLQSLNVVETGEGEAVGMATYDNQASAEDALPTVKEIMGGMAQFFAGPPELKLGPVMWSLDKECCDCGDKCDCNDDKCDCGDKDCC